LIPRFVVALIVACPASAHAYELAKTECGADLHFEAPALEYDVVFPAEDPSFSASARYAFDQWGIAMGGVLVPLYVGPSEFGARSGDQRTTIEKVSTFPFADGETTVGFTQQLYDCASGVLVDADIILNAEHFRFEPDTRGAIDPASAIVHEAGHVFGLGHTCGDPRGTFPSCFNLPPDRADEILSTVMAPTLSVSTVRRDLLPDDIAGIRALYGASSATVIPEIATYERICPGDGAFFVTGSGFMSDFEASFRLADGSTRAIVWSRISDDRAELPSAIPLDGDLLITDPRTRAYAALVAPEEPSCDPKIEEPGPIVEDGCACTMLHRDGRHFDGAASILLWMAALGALALRVSKRALWILPLVFFAQDAFAYKCSRVGADFGPSLYWSDREISWYAGTALTADLENSVALEQVRQSFEEWENIDCSDITMPFRGQEAGLKAGYDQNGGENKNVVVFLESGWPYDRGVIAVTTNAYDTRSGSVLDSDIEVNGEQFTFVNADAVCYSRTGEMDLRNAMTHEVGHVLGLDHPPNTQRNVDSTMYASAPPCETKKRTLADDDRMGICTIYPAGMELKQCYPPDGPAFAVVEQDDGYAGCTSTESSSVLLAWILVAASVLALRKRS
jgi:hypothetical protein